MACHLDAHNPSTWMLRSLLQDFHLFSAVCGDARARRAPPSWNANLKSSTAFVRTLWSSGRNRIPSSVTYSGAKNKTVWIETLQKEVLTAGLEAGVTNFLFQAKDASTAHAWQALGKYDAIFTDRDGLLSDSQAQQVGRIVRIGSRGDIERAEAFALEDGSIVMDASDWQIIPAENLVAAFQGKKANLLGVATTAKEAQILLEALEVGTDGVVLRTNSPAEVRAMMAYVKDTARLSGEQVELVAARVVRIQQVGMGDRVAVDLCSLLVPGEGLLVGSFSRGLFLVHSECNESSYINSRPFRVNCGPVHAYVAMPNGKTAYLSELVSGAEVLVVDASGRQKVAIVGRTKIETRPLVLVEAEADGEKYSILLQNAETVRLVCPEALERDRTAASLETQRQDPCWTSAAVTELKEGDDVLICRQEAARHAGVAISEHIVER